MSYFSTNVPNETLKIYKQLGLKCSKKWSGFEFFGLDKNCVLSVTTCPYGKSLKVDQSSFERIASENGPLKSLMNIRHRNAGPTHDLCHKAAKHRKQTVKNIVDYATFGDLKSKFAFSVRIWHSNVWAFVTFLPKKIQQFPEKKV